MTEELSLPAAEDAFHKGLEALGRRRHQEAITLFHTAIDLERQDDANKNPKMQYLSYLGLALVLAQGRSGEGLKLCQQAAKRDFFDPELFCNLGIVHLRHRQKALAFEAFRKGLALKPGHRRILEELERHERRGDPVFPVLPRSHLLNRLAGIARHRLRLLFGRGSTTPA